jgi:hypothetical protein
MAVWTATERTDIPLVDSSELQKVMSFLKACLIHHLKTAAWPKNTTEIERTS